MIVIPTCAGKTAIAMQVVSNATAPVQSAQGL